MANEEVVIGYRYTGQDQVNNLVNDLGRTERALAELASSSTGSAFQSVGQTALTRLSETLRGQFSALEDARARLAQAELRAGQVTGRTNVGIGQVRETDHGPIKGYLSQAEQDNAQIGSARAINSARTNLEKQYLLAAEAVRQERPAAGAVEAIRASMIRFNAAEEKRAATAERLAAEEAATGQRNLDSINQANYRRVQAEDAAARAERENANRLTDVDARLAGDRQPGQYPTTHVGQAALGVEAAEINLEAASKKLADERNSTTRTYESVRAAESRELAATRSLSSARERLTVAETRETASFGQQFRSGFKGVSDRPYAEQLGQAFKFSVLYGSAYKILFGITQTLSNALQEGIAFQQSMTELSIASGQSADQMNQLQRNLGQSATEAGFAPSQGVIVGARSLGLFGQTAGSGATIAQQNQTAEISARVVSRAAFGSGLQPEDLQRDLAAIAQAFGTGASGQVRAFDLDAYLSKRFGTGPGSTITSVSESATAGKAAGFSQEQITAIAAVLQARTAQSPQAVAGYMAQIFSRAGEGALNTLESKFGISSKTPLATQFDQLAKIYQKQPDQRDDISAVFGRGKVQNAVIALLQSYPAVQAAAKDAKTQAGGKGDAAFDQRINNLGGQLGIFVGDLKAFSSQLGRSGLLDVLGVGIKALDQFVKAATSLLEIWNQMDGVVRGLIATLLLEEGVRRSGLASGLLSSAAGAHKLGVPVGTAESAVGIGSKLKTAGEIGLVLAAITAAGSTISANNKLNTATAGTRDLLATSDLGAGATPAELQARAAALTQQADEAQKAASGFFASIIDLGDKADAARGAGAAADAEAARLTALAAYKSRVEAAAPASEALITGFDATSLSASLQSITDQGGNARDRLDALAATLNETGAAASRAKAAFDPKVFAGDAAQGALGALSGAGFVGQRTSDLGQSVGNLLLGSFQKEPAGTFSNALPGAISSVTNQGEIAKRLQAALEAKGVSSQKDITPQIASQLARSTVGTTPEEALASLGISDPEQIKKLRGLMVDAVRKSLLGQAKAIKDIVSGKTSLSPGDLTSAVNTISSETSSLLGTLQQSDTGGRVGALRRQVRLIRAAIADTPTGATSQVQDQLDAARRALADQQIAGLEDLRRAAQRNATSKKQIASIGKGFLKRELNIAIKANDDDKLVEIIGIAGKYAKQIAIDAIQATVRVAQAAIKAENLAASLASSELEGIKGMAGRIKSNRGAASAVEYAQVQALQDEIKLINSTASGNASTDTFASGSDSNNPLATNTGAAPAATKDTGPTRAQVNAARLTALAQGSESQIQTARAEIASARADMAAAKKGTVEYYSALGAYLSARNSLTDAIQAYHQNLFLLGHDATNPIVQARAALRAAQAKLAADAGKPADVRAEDKVAVQAAQADLESTRFSQRLEAAQTAEQLGRISHRAYINYLDHERDRLENIKHRTFQQQQELNTIDQALQEASSAMQGVFNFGSINLPKPYQVKRYIQEQLDVGGSAGIGSGGSSRTTNTVYVNGADTRMVIKVIKDVLGENTSLQTTKPRHR